MRSKHSYDIINAANEMHTEVKQHLLEQVNFMTPSWDKYSAQNLTWRNYAM